MKFSAKTEYGLRAILDLAYHHGNGPIQVKQISARERIPVRFLEQVMATLKCAGLVDSVRGPRGGYMLSRPPEQISLSEVIVAVEGPINVMECITESSTECDAVPICVIRDVWSDVQKAVLDTLKATNLRDLCEQRAKRGFAPPGPETYQI